MRIIVLALVAVAGCTEYYQHEYTTVRPLEGGFEVYVKNGSPDLDTENGREQLAWVANINRDNGFCPNGYEISERRLIRNGSALGVDLFAINYRLDSL